MTSELDQKTVLGKVASIVDAFGPDDEAVGLAELVRRSGVSKPSVHRLTRELVAWGVLERDGSDYRLGMRLFQMGQRVPRQRILRDVGRPFLTDLHHATGEAVHLAVAEGLELLYIDKLAGRHPVAQPSEIAGRLPLHCTATGRVLLAFGPRSRVAQVLTRPMVRVTPYTVVQPGLLGRELRHVARSGHAVEREQVRLGYLSVAGPIRGPGGAVVAALSVTAPLGRADVDRYVSLVRVLGDRVTQELAARELLNDSAHGLRRSTTIRPS
jgi:DNA-binding IclR family transcriptional regulator